MAQRAEKKWKSMLESYEMPPIDPAKEEELKEYMERRKNSFPDQNY